MRGIYAVLLEKICTIQKVNAPLSLHINHLQIAQNVALDLMIAFRRDVEKADRWS